MFKNRWSNKQGIIVTKNNSGLEKGGEGEHQKLSLLYLCCRCSPRLMS
jgi:hypothetical protein